MTKQIQDFDTPLDLGVIYASIDNEGFSEHTLQLIDNYINDILNGKTDLIQFNQQEHAGLCCAGEVLIGAYIVCDYARKSLEAGSNVGTGKANPPNWEIDELQEKLVQQWAEAKNLWSDTAEQDIESEYGSMIAKGKKIDDILAELGSVAEGVKTSKALCELAKKLNIDVPVSNAIYEAVYTDITPKEIMDKLMNRKLKIED